ncbi:hypothetical protein ACLBXM_23040 [Xanthobacteraceae bacterium A53D]
MIDHVDPSFKVFNDDSLISFLKPVGSGSKALCHLEESSACEMLAAWLMDHLTHPPAATRSQFEQCGLPPEGRHRHGIA